MGTGWQYDDDDNDDDDDNNDDDDSDDGDEDNDDDDDWLQFGRFQWIKVLQIYLGSEIPEELMRKLDRHHLNSIGIPLFFFTIWVINIVC